MNTIKTLFFFCLLPCILVACTSAPRANVADSAPKHAIDCTKIPDAVPKTEPKSRYGNLTTYTVGGKKYHVLGSAKGYHKRGVASWYGKKFDGRLTSNRERYDMLAMTAASRELPLPTYVRVKNLNNGRSVIVRVNDRGPFVNHRILDLSYAAARKLGYAEKGITQVDVQSLPAYSPKKQLATHTLPAKQIYLQVGVFSNYQRASILKAQFVPYIDHKKKIEIFSLQDAQILTAPKKARYSVRIGPLASLGASDSLFHSLQQYGLKTAMAVLQ